MLDEKKIQELKSQHGDVTTIEFKGDFIVVRSANESDYKRFSQKSAVNDMAKVSALEELGRCCIVYPDKDTLAELCYRRPVLITRAANAALEMAGADESVKIEKL